MGSGSNSKASFDVNFEQHILCETCCSSTTKTGFTV